MTGLGYPPQADWSEALRRCRKPPARALRHLSFRPGDPPTGPTRTPLPARWHRCAPLRAILCPPTGRPAPGLSRPTACSGRHVPLSSSGMLKKRFSLLSERICCISPSGQLEVENLDVLPDVVGIGSTRNDGEALLDVPAQDDPVPGVLPCAWAICLMTGSLKSATLRHGSAQREPALHLYTLPGQPSCASPAAERRGGTLSGARRA